MDIELCGASLDMAPPAQVPLTVSKPGEKADVPVGVIVGSVIAGLLLLALVVGLLWKVSVAALCWSFSLVCFFKFFSHRVNMTPLIVPCSQFGFFKRKYQQLQREADDDGPSQPHVDEVL